MLHPTRRWVLQALALLPMAAHARYPDRAIRLVVPAPPGGLTDIVGRLLAQALQSDLRQAVVVDNRPGAAGLIGTQAVADAAPDGYTLLVTSTSNQVLAPLTQQGTRVDPSQVLVPVALALRTVGLLVVPADSPARSLREFLALARARPGQLNYGSSGIGSANHVLTERLKSLARVDVVHVPYRGGAPLLNALMAAEVQLGLLDFATAEPALKGGRLRALAQSGTTRHVALPTVPTFAEAGQAGFDPSFWIGVAAPLGTPTDVVAGLNASVNRALAQVGLKARAQAFGWMLAGGPPAALADIAGREVAAFRQVLQDLRIDRQ